MTAIRSGNGTGGSTSDLEAWAACGAMLLTGRRDGSPLGPPAGLVPGVRSLGTRIDELSSALGRPVDLDPLGILGERAALAGWTRRGAVSCGGATRLLATGDAWIGLSLARSDDWELLDAWFGSSLGIDHGDWDTVAARVAASSAGELVARGAWLGLPVARLDERRDVAHRESGPEDVPGVRSIRLADASAITSMDDVLVADLSGLWAGPLAGDLLSLAGARVVKVESTSRPDGARAGAPDFYDLLNGRKRSLAIDLRTADGRELLGQVVDRADVVITSSRGRAIEQLGLSPVDSVGGGSTRVWLAISGYGIFGEDAGRVASGEGAGRVASGEGAGRVAFGDDAAVAGGLVCWDDHGPVFCADAVADPITGLAGTAAVLDALVSGGRWVIDAAMADVAHGLSGPTLPVGDPLDVAVPRARASASRAAALGADTDLVLDELGIIV